MYVIKEPKKHTFQKVGISGKIFPTSQLSSKTQYFLVETEKGHETTIIEHDSDFVYYVLEGNGFFEIENVREQCSKGDLVVVPAESKFTYKGKLKMIASSTPPWREKQEETLIG